MYICHRKQPVGGADSLSGPLWEWVSNILPVSLPKLIISICQLELCSVVCSAKKCWGVFSGKIPGVQGSLLCFTE